MAEREGFEPPDRSHGQRFSRPPHSTTLPSLPFGATKVEVFFKRQKFLPEKNFHVEEKKYPLCVVFLNLILEFYKL